MNRTTMKTDRENQQRLLQELERLSDDSSSSEHHNLFNLAQPLHDAPLFSGIHTFLSPWLAAARNQHCQQSPLLMDLQDTSHNQLMVESEVSCEADVSETEQLQVDHNGAKVQHLPFSSAWLSSSDLTDIGTCVSISTTSTSGDNSSVLSPACAAAAATAAMIVEPDDIVVKRPRSPPREELVKDERNDEDRTTETSIEQPEDPTSPRSISGFPKEEISQNKDISRKEGMSQATQKPPLSTRPVENVHPHQRIKVPADTGERTVIALSLDSARDPAACRKRRAEAMERFRRKKAVRSFGRKVRYQIRKRIATTRPRVNGRFARRCDAENQAAKTGENK